MSDLHGRRSEGCQCGLGVARGHARAWRGLVVSIQELTPSDRHAVDKRKRALGRQGRKGRTQQREHSHCGSPALRGVRCDGFTRLLHGGRGKSAGEGPIGARLGSRTFARQSIPRKATWSPRGCAALCRPCCANRNPAKSPWIRTAFPRRPSTCAARPAAGRSARVTRCIPSRAGLCRWPSYACVR